jgi:Flp pilus assembly protein TadD/predicted Zn-dependent protease
LLLGLIVCACAPTPRERQLAAAGHMTPSDRYSSTSQGAEEIDKPEELIHMRVRVYAGDGYRSETVRWRERIRHQIEAASQVTKEQFGFDLKLVQIVEWEQETDASDMQQVLAELSRRDPADDVDYVFGMTTSRAAFEPSLHLLGMAEIFGQHIVLRAMNDSAEREQLHRVFDELTGDELDDLYTARLRHKETSVMLHELGHALGAVHTRAAHWLMSPMSSTSQRAFGPANTRIVRLAIKLRAEHDTHDSWRRAFVAALVEELDGESSADFDPRAREHVKKLAAAHLDPELLSSREVRQVNRARELILQGRDEKAWEHLEPVAKARGDNPHVVGMVCLLRFRMQPDAAETVERCRAAHDIAADDPSPALFLAHLHLDSGKHAEAVAMIQEASRRMDAAEKVETHQWMSLGALYAQIGSLTLAEQALDNAPMLVGAKPVRDDIENKRHYYGLRKGAVAAEAEAELLASIRKVEKKLRDSERRGADKLIAQMRSTYGEVAATEALACQVSMMARDLKAGAKACARALKLDDNCALAHLMSGYVAMNRRDVDRAERHFEKARDLVPREKNMWIALAEFYGDTGAESALEKLRARYQERFAEPLVLR